MRHIKTIRGAAIRQPAGGKACSECQSSCQSACKTSCTVANQKCENVKR
jgi:predicted ribosomally synthesized six-cysteine peptide SCIFF